MNLLIARIAAQRVALAQRLESDRAILTDVLVYYHRTQLAPARRQTPEESDLAPLRKP